MLKFFLLKTEPKLIRFWIRIKISNSVNTENQNLKITGQNIKTSISFIVLDYNTQWSKIQMHISN